MQSPLLLAALALPPLAPPGDPDGNPVELGRVDWGRELEAALAASAERGRPVLALFQEIPGCATCKRFGEGPLSHPLMVEAIEDLFVPLAIHNNRGGADARVLERYGEPSWNNPVVRFLDDEGEDLLARRDGVWETGPLAARMVAALEAAGKDAPRWLELVVSEERHPNELATAVFAMHCFWEGEARLGALDGVVATRVGWLEGREVVEVRYDPARVGYAALVGEAKSLGCASRVWAATDRELELAREAVGGRAARGGEGVRDAKPSDEKHALARSHLRLLPLTPMQRAKVNAALGTGGDPTPWLSPRQRALADRVRAALAEEEGALAGLAPPEEVEELPAYERALRERLGA